MDLSGSVDSKLQQAVLKISSACPLFLDVVFLKCTRLAVGFNYWLEQDQVQQDVLIEVI